MSNKFLIPLVLLFSLSASAQKIVEFNHRVYQNEYGNPNIEIKPAITTNESGYGAEQKVYGVRICYTLNGKKKVARQDMTYQLHKKGVFTYGLGYSKTAKVTVTDIVYFNIVDEKDESKWPKKEECL